MRDSAEFSVALLGRVGDFLNQLTPEQLKDLIDGRAQLAVVAADAMVVVEQRQRPTKPSRTDPKEIARTIRTVSDTANVYAYLESLPKTVTINSLMAVARILDVEVDRGIRKKPIWEAIANASTRYGLSDVKSGTAASDLDPHTADRAGDGHGIQKQHGSRLAGGRRLDELAAELPKLATREDVVAKLEQEGLSADEMRELARILKVTVPSGRSRVADIRDVIAEATVGYRLKAAAIFQGIWPT